ncbi:hypothetical protein K3495_g1795 [Podosphaera aphanis]|nr:hypothetical protein K3495_g1795 [Podosphaera aphanis]
MGSSTSKTATASPKTQLWSNETPVQFSPNLVESLQQSPESDSTRAKALELHIQSRVNAELRRLQAIAAKEYADLQAKISAEESDVTQEKSAGDILRNLGREVVQDEIRGLKSKLEQRKQVRELDESVASVKQDLVSCLTENKKRPLDCWATVQKFREEVARLEDGWVDKIVK